MANRAPPPDRPDRPDRPRPGQGKATPNRSLERGIAVLRAFRAGASMLGNSEIAERTGLSRSTVSRLTQSLVETGMLDYIPRYRAYRLGVPVLSMAHAMRDSSEILKVATPLMVEVAMRHRINVGLAVPDGDEMVYLESFRYNRRQSLRTVVTGQRIPMALTSLGRAYLATLDQERLAAAMAALARPNGTAGKGRHGERRQLLADIEAATESVRTKGYCVAAWQPQVVALATPLRFEGYGVHVLNVSVATQQDPDAIEAMLAGPLLSLGRTIQRAMETAAQP